MAADEYYDAVGEILSYVLSAEDFIVGQIEHEDGIYFNIRRDNTNLELFAEPDNRYFILIYRYSITKKITAAYQNENQLLRGDLERYDIDEENLGDRNLEDKVAVRRVMDVDEEKAKDLVLEVRELATHTDCRIQETTRDNPWTDEEEEVWNGVNVAGLLYPYEDNFTPRNYEQIAQEVISVGHQIENAMGKLKIIEEVGG